MLCHQQKRAESVLATGEARRYQGIQNSSITPTNVTGCMQQIEMIINEYQHLIESSSSDCYFLTTNWFNLADTTGGLYRVTKQNSDFSNSVEILKDLLSSSLTTLENLTRCGASLTQTFQVDSGIAVFNVLANLNIGDTVFSLTDATGTSYIHYQAVWLKLLMVYVYIAEIDDTLTDAQKYVNWIVTVSYPSGGINK